MGKRPKNKTTIEIEIDVRSELRRHGTKGETYSEIVRRLMQEANSKKKHHKKP